MRILNLFFEKIKTKNSLGGCDPSDDSAQGINLNKQSVSSPKNGWPHRNLKKKDLKVQNEISQSIETYIEESNATQPRIVQNALSQSKVF